MSSVKSWRSEWLLLVLLLACCLTTRTAHGLDCFQCVSTNSTRPFLCNEFLSNSEDLDPESCDNVYNAQYCIKHVGRFEGGIGTKRFCSSVDLGNYCDYVQQPGDKLSYRTCVYTCSSDGCNPATHITPSTTLNSFLAILSFAYILLR